MRTSRTFVATLGLALASLLVPAFAFAKAHTFEVDAVHSAVSFKIRHLVAKTNGEFADYSGTIAVDPEDVAGTLKINATVQAGSIDTDNEKRDQHLRSPDFFATDEHPEITYESTSVKKKGENTYEVIGNLTMRGVTQEVLMTAEVLGVMANPMRDGAPVIGMDLTGTVDRQAFGISWNNTLDQGGLVLGNDVEVEIHIEANAPKE